MDYIDYWSGFQKEFDKNTRVKGLFDGEINDKGNGKDKNSYVFDFKVPSGNDKVLYNLVLILNTRSSYISVDMYFKKKKKHAEDVLNFFLVEKDCIQRNLGSVLYINNLEKSEIRISLRKPIHEFDEDSVNKYYGWYIENMIKMYDEFEGLRYKKGFYPERKL